MIMKRWMISEAKVICKKTTVKTTVVTIKVKRGCPSCPRIADFGRGFDVALLMLFNTNFGKLEEEHSCNFDHVII